jgi:hypothetical protein
VKKTVSGSVILVVLAFAIAPVAAGAQTSTPSALTGTIDITPNVDLVDGQLVTVTGDLDTDFTLLEIFQCKADPVDERDCDPDNSDFIGRAIDGTFPYVFMVDARIYTTGGEEVDCRATPGACTIGIGFLLDAGEAVHAPLFFDPNAPLMPPVTATVTPSEGLTDGQVVRVRAQNLSDRFQTFVYQCVAGQEPSAETCAFYDDKFLQLVSEGGAIDEPFTVMGLMQPTTGPPIDCTVAPGTCEIRVSWGLSTAPDREVLIPLGFATTPEPTAPTTAATTPVPTAAPRFTG